MDRGRKISGKKKRKENKKWTVDGEKVKSKWTEEEKEEKEEGSGIGCCHWVKRSVLRV